ncbi:MAG: hypothetical protein HKN80_10940 [Acidimicrobiia bacterium]|nr:hypothetical protein [Acidimicrobiia bacterium]
MEDRLKAAFEQESEHLHAPHGSPETAIRRGRRRRASNLIGGAAVVFVLIGGTAAGVQYLGSSDDPVPQDLASSTETSIDETTATNTAAVDFSWQRSALPTPDGAEVWNVQVVADADGFVAIGTGYVPSSPEERGNQILVWRSDDGADWTLQSTESTFDGSLDTILTTDDGFVAIVRSFDGSFDTATLYTSPDGATWTAAGVDLGDIAEDQYLWFNGAASGNGATVLAGALQTEPTEPPVVFEEAGVVLQQNNRDGSFTVTDLATGELITVLSNEAVYGGGPVVYGPDGELIVALSEELMEEAFSADTAGRFTVEQEGIRVDIDYNEDRYVATDTATETVLTQGSVEDLFRSGQLVVVDPNSNETLLDINMDDFYAAQDEAWRDRDGEYFPTTELIVLATTNGTTWKRIDLGSGAAQELNVGGVGFGPDGFFVSVVRYGSQRPEHDVWRSTDGMEWELSSSVAGTADSPIISAGDAYYQLSDGRRAAIVRSTDGVDWTLVHQPDDRGTYYSELAAGGLGVVAIGQHQENTYGPPVVIAKDGRTLVVDGETGRITVTEDTTGEVLTTIEIDVFQEEPPDQIIEDTANGMIIITDVDGTVVMEFTEDEANAASEGAESEYEYSVPKPAVAFSRDGEDWFTATTVGLDIAWSQGIAVGASAVVIVGESAEAYGEFIPGEDDGVSVASGDSTTLTTTIAADYSPTTYVWVGRPR